MNYILQTKKSNIWTSDFKEFLRQIGYAVLQLRKEAKLSQADLAKKIGTSQGNIARIELGNENTTVRLLYRIARATKHDLKIELVKN